MPKPAAKKTIAVDIDDVLAEHIEPFLEFSNKNYGTNFVKEDYLEQWHELWGASRKEVENRAKHFHTPDNVGGFGVIENALLVLTKLKKDYELVIVTSRPRDIVDLTPPWINQNFPNTFSDIHFVPTWDPGPKKSKAEICKEIGADYLIDDLVRHCNLAAETGIKAILFNRIKWKQPEKPHPEVTIVSNWQEVLEYFDGR